MKNKILAWLLTVAMTIGSVSPVFASEAFSDGSAGSETFEMQQQTEESTEEEAELFSSGEEETFTGTDSELPSVNAAVGEATEITSVEIAGGTEHLRKDWLYGFLEGDLGTKSLTFNVKVGENCIAEGIKVDQVFEYDGDDYVIYDQYVCPENFDSWDWKVGRYEIEFELCKRKRTETGFVKLNVESMPKNIVTEVKLPGEFSAGFPVLEEGIEYSLEKYQPDYLVGDEKFYVFRFVPKITGIYDVSELLRNSRWMQIMTDNDEYDFFYQETVYLEEGKTHVIVMGQPDTPFSFQIHTSKHQIKKFELVNREQVENTQVIPELIDEVGEFGFFGALFDVLYTDAKGNEKSGRFRCGEPIPGHGPIAMDFDRSKTGMQEMVFFPMGAEGLKISCNLNFVSLASVRDSLPKLEEGNDLEFPTTNYNLSKCFTFTPKEDGTYSIDFGVLSNVCYLDEKNTLQRPDGSSHCEFTGKAGHTYVFNASPIGTEAGEIQKISVRKSMTLKSLEIINEPTEPILWGYHFGFPYELNNLKFRFTTEEGLTGEINYGQGISDFGWLDVTGYEDEIGQDILGDMNLSFFFTGVPQIKTKEIKAFGCKLEEMNLPEIETEKQTVLKRMTDNSWVASFVPNKTGKYKFEFSETAQEKWLYRDSIEGLRWNMDTEELPELEKGKKYLVFFRSDYEDFPEVSVKAIGNKSIEKISLSKNQMELLPGQEGKIIAFTHPKETMDQLKWSMDESQGSGFHMAPSSENPNEVVVKADKDATGTVIIKAETQDSSISATCTVTISQEKINASVPPIDGSVPVNPPEEIEVGMATKPSDGTESDADKASQNIKKLTENIAVGTSTPGMETEPGISGSTLKEEMNKVTEEGGQILTEVVLQPVSSVGETEKNEIIEVVLPNVDPTSLKIEKALDINVEIKGVTEGVTKELGKITKLPDSDGLVFTVLLTKEQSQKKMYVAYKHEEKPKLLPEAKVTQKDGVVKFTANEFSEYYLISSEEDFTVTYKNISPDGRTDTAKVSYGVCATKKEVSANNYRFEGWYEEKTGNLYDFTEPVTGDVILIGKWTYVPPVTPPVTPPVNPPVTYYTIRFDSQGGSAVSSQSLTYGSKIQEPEAPVREGYTFEGWYKEAECTNPWDFTKDTVTSSHTLYAKWTAVPVVPDKPAAVENVEVATSSTTVKLTWEKVKDADGYEVFSRNQGEEAFTLEKTLDGESASYAVKGLKPGTVKEYIVRSYRIAEDQKIYSDDSEILTAVTKPSTVKITSTYSKKGYLKVKLAGKAAGADGYEYAYSTKTGTWSAEKDYKVFGRTKSLSCASKKVPSGVYNVRVRGYKEVNGIRVYGKWSSEKWVELPTGTLSAPKIVKVKVNKNTVSVTLKGVKGASGYDVVLGSKHNQIKPTSYKYIKKNQKTTTIVFKKVKKGTYYIGAHAYKTQKGRKYFSKWSNQKKIVIK